MFNLWLLQKNFILTFICFYYYFISISRLDDLIFCQCIPPSLKVSLNSFVPKYLKLISLSPLSYSNPSPILFTLLQSHNSNLSRHDMDPSSILGNTSNSGKSCIEKKRRRRNPPGSPNAIGNSLQLLFTSNHKLTRLGIWRKYIFTSHLKFNRLSNF